jgi:hypothetical protein
MVREAQRASHGLPTSEPRSPNSVVGAEDDSARSPSAVPLHWRRSAYTEVGWTSEELELQREAFKWASGPSDSSTDPDTLEPFRDSFLDGYSTGESQGTNVRSITPSVNSSQTATSFASPKGGLWLQRPLSTYKNT